VGAIDTSVERSVSGVDFAITFDIFSLINTDLLLMNNHRESFNNCFVRFSVNWHDYFFNENFGLNSFDNSFVMVVNNRLFNSFFDNHGLDLFNDCGLVFVNSFFFNNSFFFLDRG